MMNAFYYTRRLMAVMIPAIFLFASAAPTAAQQNASPIAPI